MNIQTSIARITHPKTLAGRLRSACFTRLLPPLLLLTLPAVVQAQFTYTDNGDGTATITGGPGGDVNIPSMIDGLLVTSIGYEAFYNGASPGPGFVTSVTIPDTVTSIGFAAFAWNYTLKRVTLGSGLVNIGDVAFGDCGLTTITIPSAVTSIGDSAFAYCALTGVYFLGNAPSLGGPSVFAGDFNSVYYLFGTTGWGPTFGGCPTALWSPSGYIYTTNNGTVTITGYTGPGGDLTIPSTISGLPVTGVGNSAFADCTSVTSITIPNSVTAIGFEAFSECTSLTNVTIGNGVTNIANDAFFACVSLTGLTIPESVTTIGGSAFTGCGLTSVTISSNVTYIGSYAFIDCADLNTITVDALNSFYCSVDGVLFDKSQTTLIQCPGGRIGCFTIPNSVTNISDYAFCQCSTLTSVTIPDSVTNIGGYAFWNTGLTSVTIGSGVSDIGNSAFALCGSLTNVTIPNSVTSIEDWAFTGCISLTNVTIPDGVTSVGDGAFYYCANLTAIHFLGNPPSLGGAYVFQGDTNATVYYLPGTTGWGATFGSRPTALWLLPNPLILTSGPGFGMQSNAFGFIISWATNTSVVVEACTNPANHSWSSLKTNALTSGWSYFSDPQWANYPGRFYRVRSP
jgi:hypothetical protein